MDYQLGPGPLQVDQNTIDEKIKGDIGIVENGDVATHAIPSGYYVIWKGDLYVAKTDISSGTTLSTSNLTAKPNGLGADVAALNSKMTYHDDFITSFESNWSSPNVKVMYNSIFAIVRVNTLKRSETANGWVNAFQLPSGMRNLPLDYQYGFLANDSGMSGGVTNVVQARVTKTGYVQIYNPRADMATWGSIVFFL